MALTCNRQGTEAVFQELRIMQVDLLAGTVYAARTMPQVTPTILIFDSGLGGLTVHAQVAALRPDARFVYVADDAAFPYGRLSEAALIERVASVMERLIAQHRPDLVVIACNTASTLVMPALRAQFDIPFVGTVPAIKPAAETTQSRLISVLATPGTVARDYTRGLIQSYAAGCDVTLVGSKVLAGLAEAALRGETVDDAAIAAEIAPCFQKNGDRKTDVVTLSCTHYPLLLERFRQLAPWPVTWIDPAPAIARRVTQLIGAAPAGATYITPQATVVFTGAAILAPALQAVLAGRGLGNIRHELMPLVQ
jgi:glutamate racemase